MSEQEIKVGSEWQQKRGDCVKLTIVDLAKDGEIPLAVYRLAGYRAGSVGVIQVRHLIEQYEPHIREPRVGEVWRWKAMAEVEIIALVPERSLVVALDVAGYHVIASGNFAIGSLEYVRQGPL